MARDKSKPGRSSQLRQAYRATKQLDPRLGVILLSVFVGVTLVMGALATFFIAGVIFGPIIGLLFGSLATLFVFGRRAQAANYAQLDGKPGAGAAALGMLRRGWKVEPMVAFTKQQDIVTRVVGPPGIVLIGDGNMNRLKPLMASERRRHAQVASETPIHEIYLGEGEGQVPIRKLVRQVSRMKRAIKPAEMTDILQRLKAVDARRGAMPIPKGPLPTSMKGQRGNLRGR
ncbi:MAG: DUF4191 domain-containing protein [Marmoricola sp.]